MKKLITTLYITFGFLSVNPISIEAQTVREIRMNVLESDRMGFSIEFNFDQKTLKDAWDKKCDDLSIKSKPSKGFDVYSAVLIPDIHYESMDVYVDIEKLDKSRSQISFTVSRGNTNFITKEDTKMVTNTEQFLTKFITYAEQYKLSLDIAMQEELIKDIQKDYDKLVEDGKKLQAQIDENKIDQENKVKELDALNKGLEELKLKKK